MTPIALCINTTNALLIQQYTFGAYLSSPDVALQTDGVRNDKSQMAIIKCVIRSHRTQNESNATEKISTTVAIIDAGGFFPQQCTTRMPTSNVGCLGAFEHTDASPTPLPLRQQPFCTIHYLSEIYHPNSAMTGGPSEGGGWLLPITHQCLTPRPPASSSSATGWCCTSGR